MEVGNSQLDEVHTGTHQPLQLPSSSQLKPHIH
jgi:hypothetical protein